MKAEEEKAAKGKRGGGGGGHGKNSVLNGRALFTYNKELFQDDVNAADIEFEDDEVEERKEEKKAPVDAGLFGADAGGA